MHMRLNQLPPELVAASVMVYVYIDSGYLTHYIIYTMHLDFI